MGILDELSSGNDGNIWAALSGLGAGLQGQGAQWQQAESQRRQALSVERKRAAAEDLMATRALLTSNDPQSLLKVRELWGDRLSVLQEEGRDPRHTVQFLSMLDETLNSAPEEAPTRISNLLGVVDNGINSAVRAGIIEPEPDTYEPIYDAQGNVIGQMNTRTGERTADPEATVRLQQQQIDATNALNQSNVDRLNREEMREIRAAQKAEDEAATEMVRNLEDAEGEFERIEGYIQQMIGKIPEPNEEGEIDFDAKWEGEHEGFRGRVGYMDEKLGAFSSNQRDFEQRHKQIVEGEAFLQGIERMKGTGTITEIEGKKAQDALARASLALDEADYKRAMYDFYQALAAPLNRARERAAVDMQRYYQSVESR